eukprot:COSAG06_NODE_20899_length_777_cov_1.138643_1_plen_84_part_10
MFCKLPTRASHRVRPLAVQYTQIQRIKHTSRLRQRCVSLLEPRDVAALLELIHDALHYLLDVPLVAEHDMLLSMLVLLLVIHLR